MPRYLVFEPQSCFPSLFSVASFAGFLLKLLWFCPMCSDFALSPCFQPFGFPQFVLILGLRHHQLRCPVGQVRWGGLRRTLFRRDIVSEPDLRTTPSTRSLRTHTHKRLQGYLPNPPDTEHALTHRVRRLRSARAPRVSHTESQSDQKKHPRQPVPAPQKPVEKCRKHGMRDVFRTAAAAALAQARKTAHSIADSSAMSAYRQNLLSGEGMQGM